VWTSNTNGLNKGSSERRTEKATRRKRRWREKKREGEKGEREGSGAPPAVTPRGALSGRTMETGQRGDAGMRVRSEQRAAQTAHWNS